MQTVCDKWVEYLAGTDDKIIEDEMSARLTGIGENLTEHVVDTTAFLSVVHPTMAVFETAFAGMANESSINARLFSTALNYCGLGSIYSRGRDLSMRLFNITKETRERIKQIHDAIYCTALTIVIQPPFYYAAGVRNTKEVAMGTLAATLVGLFIGPPAGYALDAYRDLTGIKQSERLPAFLRKMSVREKKYAAALLTAASVAATAAVYALNK